MPSTAIRRFSYDGETRTLFITFVDGDLYAYRDVGPEVPEAMGKAVSKGRFFARQVRGRYAYAKMPAESDGPNVGKTTFNPPAGERPV